MRKQLSNSEIREIRRKLGLDYGLTEIIPPTAQVTLIDNLILMIDDEPLFFSYKGRWAPTVRLLLRSNFLKEIVIDKGAIRFILEGADVMRPGIIGFHEEIKQGELVAVVDEVHHKPIAVGEALQSAMEIKLATKGPMVKTIHYVGDRLWTI